MGINQGIKIIPQAPTRNEQYRYEEENDGFHNTSAPYRQIKEAAQATSFIL